jgi:photosystem II stability/assembly factor-like uncharacterized protein
LGYVVLLYNGKDISCSKYWEDEMQIKNNNSLTRKTLYGIMLLGVFLSAFGGASTPFVQALSLQSDIQLAGFDALSTTEGWVQLNHSLFWTSDGGQTWTNITPAMSANASLLTVKFTDEKNGWVLWADDAASHLSHTTDGVNWITQACDLSNDAGLTADRVWMGWLDSRTGWISARWSSGVNFSLGTLWRTEDGGATWLSTSLPLGEAVYFVDPQNGWLAGGPAGDQLFYTDDAGSTWTASQSFAGENSTVSIVTPRFSDFTHGLLPAFRKMDDLTHLEIYTTHDGKKWELSRSDEAQPSLDAIPLAWLNAQTMFVINGNELLQVTELGSTQLAAGPILEAVQELDMVSDTYGWAKWEDGSCAKNAEMTTCSSTTKLLRTVDGGKTWNALPLPLVQSDKIARTFVTENPSAQPGLAELSNTETVTGQGFDKCEVPTISQLQTWKTNSPYIAVNLYGGSCRGCANTVLSEGYVSSISQQGWKFIPTWVGPQAPSYGGTCANRFSLNTTTAYDQGVAEANSAISYFSALGFEGSVIYYDLEMTSNDERTAAQSFINGWVYQLNARGWKAGVYGAAYASHLSDFDSIANKPDVIWPAAWYHNSGQGYYDPNATVWVNQSYFPNTLWPTHQRIRQYEGDHNETYASVTLNIDSNAMDGVVAVFSGGGTTIPSGFNQIQSGIGVALYKKDYAGGQPDYVQVVGLNQGASVKLMTGSMASPGTGGGPFGGNNPTFTKTSLSTAWNDFNASTSGAFCISNGGFFNGLDNYPVPLAFALKQNNVMVSDGANGSGDASGPVMMLELWGDHADIRSLTRDNLYGSSAPNILGGLSETADKSSTSYVGRTFIGIDDTNGDSLYDTVLVFNSSYARQIDATTVLRNFGADKVIMLDGGGSTQLRCGANAYVSSSRVIPQTIGVVAGSNSVPNTPSNVRVDHSTQTDITIAWDDTSNETGYKIYKWDWVSSFVYFDSVGANITSFTDDTLGCDNEAYYEVSAYNVNGESVHAGWVHGYTLACSAMFDLFLPLVRR